MPQGRRPTLVWITFDDPRRYQPRGHEPDSSRIHGPRPGGSGSGCLIGRRIVREHGGEMSCCSNEGQGRTLSIRLRSTGQSARMRPGHRHAE